ncbi:M23 family metallopeptidase [Parasalinivibrio latis]|uniref:M23 family metallopeptidase n=1 Tax=Parasalinivibrio latis TaxID=2952610 RepID=UPI0030E2012C
MPHPQQPKGNTPALHTSPRPKLALGLGIIVLALFAGMGTQLYLQGEKTKSDQVLIDDLHNTISSLNNANKSLNASNHLLNLEAEVNRQSLQEKDAQLVDLTNRVDEVESWLGMAPAEDENLTSRLNTAAMTAALRTTMMRLVPNGEPIESFRRSSGYGVRKHPVTGTKRYHTGLDLTADIGTPVYAPADGVIELVRPSRKKGYGNLIKMSHAFGFMTMYAHLNKFNVKSGQFVKKGDLIGWSGNTGLSTGPHLHYEVRFLGRAMNPKAFMAWSPDNFDSLFEKEKSINWTALVNLIEHSLILQPASAEMAHASLGAQKLTKEEGKKTVEN